MRTFGAIIIAVWVSWFLSVPALAEKRVALVIGNSAYENVARLGNPANDATAMTATLKEAGFDVVDSRLNLNNADMRRAFRDFSDKVHDADVAVVYFAGHGMEVDGTNYLIPVDAALERDLDAYDEAFPLDRILTTIEPAKQLRLVILDACRLNPFVKTMKRTTGSRSIGRGLARIEPSSPNTLIAFASKADSIASDGDSKNSPFTSALIRYIATPGLDLRKAFGFVRDDVLKSTSNRQEPYVYGSLGGDDVPLVPAKPVLTAPANPQADIRRDYEFALQLGTREGWNAFLSQFPEGYYGSLAKGQLNKIASEEARAKVAAAEQARTAAERPAAEQTAAMKLDAGAVAGIGQAAEKAADDKALTEAKPEVPKLPQVASLPAETTAVSALAAGLLIKEIKIELKRTGCYSGRIDENWPKGSSNEAVRKFARYARLSSAPEEPSDQLLEMLKSKPDGFCPLECGGREVERNGRCIKREAPRRAMTPKPLSAVARADAAYRNGTYRVCMGATTGCYARRIKFGEENARQWCSRQPTC
jgi:caspase domain-containing protein